MNSPDLCRLTPLTIRQTPQKGLRDLYVHFAIASKPLLNNLSISLLAFLVVIYVSNQLEASENLIDRIIREHRPTFQSSDTQFCTDAEYLRRITIDVTGFLPTEKDLSDFINNPSVEKRREKIEQLLSTDAYGWKWGQWLALMTGCQDFELRYAHAELQINVGQLTYCWVDWMRARIARDEPYDKIVESCLTATSREGKSGDEFYTWLENWKTSSRNSFEGGHLYASRQTNDLLWRRNSSIFEPNFAAEDFAERFLGVRLECARCHDHPFEKWTQDQHRGFVASFQRVRYAELPFERSEKKSLATLALLALGSVVTLCLTAIALLPRVRRIFLLPVFLCTCVIFLGALAAIPLSYTHIFSNQLNPTRTSPARWLAEHFPIADPKLALVGSLSIFLAFLTISAFASFRVYRKITRPAGTGNKQRTLLLPSLFLVGFSLFSAVDAGYQLVCISEFKTTDILAHQFHRQILRYIGLGGNAQQPREVYVSDDWFPERGEPTLLDGTKLATQQIGVDPRTEIARWLRQDSIDLLSNHIVDKVWEEYFSLALKSEVQDEVNRALQADLLKTLSRDFRENGWSLKRLHRQILSSDLYQLTSQLGEKVPPNVSIFERFHARRLSARQWIAAVDQLTGTTTDFGTDSAPKGATPFQVGMLYPEGEDFGANALRLIGAEPASSGIRLEAAMLGIIDTKLRSKIGAPGGRLDSLLRTHDSDEVVLRSIFPVAFSRLPTNEEQEFFVSYVKQSEDRREAWTDIVWGIINSPEFQHTW